MLRILPLMLIALLSACTYAPRDPEPSQRRVTEVARFETDQVTGVAVSSTGRLFACFPYWSDGHRIHVAEVNTEDGTFQPYPDEAWNDWDESKPILSGMAPDHFVCVQALYVDDRDKLWVLDPASPRMAGLAANARPKLLRFDLATNTLERSYFFDNAVAPPNSYLNDVRIDNESGHAFITDSNLGGLIVLDTSLGIARRVLANHPSTMAEPDCVPVIEGRELRLRSGPNAGNVPQIHSDGIALDAARQWLYWQALTARTLYRIPTAALIDPAMTDEQLAVTIENLGTTVVTDGIEIDVRGNIYFTALEFNAVVIRVPSGELFTLTRSGMFAWPDSIAFGPKNSLYFSISQINRTPMFNETGLPPTTPFRIFKTSQYGR